MAWTRITRRQYRRYGLRYASDTTDAGDRATHAAAGKLWAATRDQPARNGECDLLHRPIRLPVAHVAERSTPHSTVQRYFYAWRDEGRWQTINHALLMDAQEVDGREASPSGGIIDSQSVKTTKAGGPRGYAGEMSMAA